MKQANPAAVDATLTASRTLLGVVARSVADALDEVTLPQFRILVVLSAVGPLRMSSLAARFGANQSTFSRSVDRMVDGGWVLRKESPDSRREVLIDLAPGGTELVSRVTDRRREEIARILAPLSRDNQKAVARALELFSAAAGEPALEDLLTLGL